MKQAPLRCKDLAISDSGFVFDPVSGTVFTVNSTGRAILTILKKGATNSEISEALSTEFDVAENDVERDIDEFLDMLRGHRFLQSDEN